LILTVNEILHDPNSNKQYRILWIDESSYILFVIDIDDNNDRALPFKRRVEDIKDELIRGILIKEKQDPYFSIIQQTPNETN